MGGNFVVVARSDGRAGFKPFGTYGKEQAGAKVAIGGKEYTVTKDGRINIPKEFMDKYGTANGEGRKVAVIRFKSAGGKDGWKKLDMEIKEPAKEAVEQKTGEKPKKLEVKDDRRELQPADNNDGSWSS